MQQQGVTRLTWCAMVPLALVATCSAIPKSLAGEPGTPPAGPPKASFVATSAYQKELIDGWTVLVNKSLFGAHRELGDRALRLLRIKLFDIGRVVPAGALNELRKVPIWIGISDGHAPCAEYHPSAEWLRANGYNPEKAKSVEIGTAACFEGAAPLQPWMLLHELAHAYLDALAEPHKQELQGAYAAAIREGRYKSVLHISGRRVEAYALASVQEYFAEGTEAYFGTNDFFPFVRAELAEHDPRLARALSQAWSAYDRPAPMPVRCLAAGSSAPPSQLSYQPAQLIFENRSRNEIAVFWIDQNGVQQPRGQLSPGASAQHSTFEGHTFLLTSGARWRGVVVVPKNGGSATITEELLSQRAQ